MQIKLWKGYHGPLVSDLIKQSWKSEDLLILCPPNMDENFDFFSLLPKGNIEFFGDWEKTQSLTQKSYQEYPAKPVFGIFTSGTTGRKLVLYSKKNIESSLNAILSLFNSRSYSSVFCYPQPFHTFGLILGYCHSMLYFKKLVTPEGVYRSEFHKKWLEWDDRGLITLGTPTHFKDLLEFVEKGESKPRETYSSIIGAAKVEKVLWESIKNILRIKFPSIGYGATEASPGITHLAPGICPSEDGEVGKFLSHINIDSFSKEGLEFSGPAVCLAIIQNNQVEFPKSILIKDVLEKREDGFLLYKGRSDLVLNRGGEKFSLEEIENYLKESMNIDTVCVSIAHPRLGEELGIVAKNSKTSKDVIYETLKQRFGRDFDNDNYQSLTELPVSPSSKLDRKECKEIMEKKLAAPTLNV